MQAIRALVREREARAALAVWLVLPTLFLFFNLTLAVDPSAHVAQLPMGAVVLDTPVSTPQGDVSIGPRLVAGLQERAGLALTPYPDEQALRDAVLAREVSGGIVVPAGTTAGLLAGTPVELTVVRSDANDQFSNAFTAGLAGSLTAMLNAALPALQSGTPAQPLVTVAADTVATTPDFRFAQLPAFLLLPLWIAGVAFAILLARAGDQIRTASGIVHAGAAEAAFVPVAAGVTAAVVALDVALFTWQWGIDLVGLFAFLWLALTAVGWLLLGTVRTFGLALGAGLGVVALFLQQPISGAAFPASFAPDAVRWAEPIAPLRYLVEGIRDLLIGGTTLPDMAVAMAAFAVTGLVLVAVGATRLAVAARRRRPAAVPTTA